MSAADIGPNAEDFAQACELVDAIGPVEHRETAIAVAAVKLAERRMTGQIEGMTTAARSVGAALSVAQ